MYMSIMNHALDTAIARMARSEFEHLTRGLLPKTIGERINYAFDQLGKLSIGDMPIYDEWVSLLYGLWYLPKHIHFVFQMLEDRNFPETLHIVDYGCGSFAMQFGVALAIAKALHRGARISRILIDAFDPSDSMIKTGDLTWSYFKDIVHRNRALRSLHDACNIINYRSNLMSDGVVDLSKLRFRIDQECWLSALHVVYKSNALQVKGELSKLCSYLSPMTGIITVYRHERKASLAKLASPFESDKYVERCPELSQGFGDATLNKVTQFRRTIYDRFAAYVQESTGLLLNPVTWTPKDVLYLIYNRCL